MPLMDYFNQAGVQSITSRWSRCFNRHKESFTFNSYFSHSGPDPFLTERTPEELERIDEVINWARGPDHDKKWTVVYPLSLMPYYAFPPFPVPFKDDSWQVKALGVLTVAGIWYLGMARHSGWHATRYQRMPYLAKEMMADQMRKQRRIARDAKSALKDRFYQ